MHLSKKGIFDLVGYHPHPGQLAVHKSTAPRRILCTGVRWGKTKCAAMEALAAAMEPKTQSVGWVVSATYDLADRVYREIVLCSAEHFRHRIISMRDHDKRLVLRNLGGGTSEIRAKSADNPISLLGEGCDWIVIDEGARLKASIWESFLSQRLLDKRGWALMISTPKGKGWLHALWQRGQGGDPDYESWNFPSWTNPRLDRALIEAERQRLPERVFAQEYGGAFIEGAGQVFRNVRGCATGEFQEPRNGAWYAAGLDLARIADFTVLVVVNEQHEVVYFDRFHRLDWSIQVARIKAALGRYGNASVLVDSTGQGEPVVESLLEAGIRAEGYTMTAASKAALISNLTLLLEQGRVVLPRPEICPELISELESFEFSISDAGNIRTAAPSGMHDDTVIALALAMYEARDAGPIEIYEV